LKNPDDMPHYTTSTKTSRSIWLGIEKSNRKNSFRTTMQNCLLNKSWVNTGICSLSFFLNASLNPNLSEQFISSIHMSVSEGVTIHLKILWSLERILALMIRLDNSFHSHCNDSCIHFPHIPD